MEGRVHRMVSASILILISTDCCILFSVFSMGSAGLLPLQWHRRMPGVATNPFDGCIVIRWASPRTFSPVSAILSF